MKINYKNSQKHTSLSNALLLEADVVHIVIKLSIMFFLLVF